MAEIKLFTDSSSDMPPEFYEEHGIDVVPFYTTFDKTTYLKELLDLTPKDFYVMLKEKNTIPSTSMPSEADYTEAFRPYLERGMDVFCVCITSKFSGSYQCAKLAANNLRAEFPHREVYVLDSMQASGGEGVVLMQAVSMIKAGRSVAEMAEWLEEKKNVSRVFLTIDDLKFLRMGGRIGKVAALGGTLLQIKPIIVQKDGELNPVSKVRGRKNAIDRVVEMTEEYVGGRRDEYDYAIVQADCEAEGDALKERLVAMGYDKDLPVLLIGVCIGSHTGPTLLGICVMPKFKG